MRVARRGTRRAMRSSSRLSGTERANNRWLSEKMRSSRTSRSASSARSRSMPRSVSALMRRASVMVSGRLLRRHLVHLAGLQVEAHAMDLVEVGAGDANETRAVRIVDRMDRAVLVDAGLPGIEAVALRLLQLGVLLVAAGLLPLDHVGVFRRLPVDRPRLTVIVRRRLARLVVDVREHLEAEVLVLVEHLQAGRHVLAAGPRHEFLVLQQPLEPLGQLPRGTGGRD